MQQVRGERTSLGEIALLFLRLGSTAFGGPPAHIAMMEEEVVRRRGWLGRAEFLDLLGATNLIPGPNSTEMAIHVGYRRAGWSGLVVAGGSFILPAFLIVFACAWAYERYHTLPAVDALFYGIKPVIIAVVVQALWSLGRTAVRSWPLAALGLVIAVAAGLGMNEVLLLVVAGAVTAAARWSSGGAPPGSAMMVLALGVPVQGALASAAPFSLGVLFLTFAKIGAVLFGSGYVLLAFLRADLVERLGWLSEAQLLDAVAVGQVTPGPVFTTATFVGYLVGGGAGAVIATVGIFLPAFVFVALSGPLVPRLRRSPIASAFLDGVNIASLALMLVVTVQLARAAIIDVPTSLLSAASAVLLLRYRINSAWLVLAGAAAGLLLSLT